MTERWRAWLVVVALSGCSGEVGGPGSDSGTEGATPSDAGADAGAPVDGGVVDAGHSPEDAGVPDAGAPDASVPVPTAPCSSYDGGLFLYEPSWPGVTKVEVYGAFGTAQDWTGPFLALSKDPDGVFRGTASLPNGQYPYVFKVTGDSVNPSFYWSWFLDPRNPDLVACPPQAPIYGASSLPYGCSQLTVPFAPAPAFHLYGATVDDGLPLPGMELQFHRNETQFHHYIANRGYSGANSGFDACVATGRYEIRVYNRAADYQPGKPLPDPSVMQQSRYAVIGRSVASADTELPLVDLADHGYGQMTPEGTNALPVVLSFAMLPGAVDARADVFNPAPGSGIGDASFESYFATATSVTFDGGFYNGTRVQSGMQYYWGNEQRMTADPSGAAWDRQSMVLPISFQ